jgi:hypothetical protein
MVELIQLETGAPKTPATVLDEFAKRYRLVVSPGWTLLDSGNNGWMVGHPVFTPPHTWGPP